MVPAGGSGWLALDLSGVPVAQRSSVVLQWYGRPDIGYTTGPLQGGCPTWEGVPYLSDYVVEVNSAPGGGQPPDTGWEQVASVSGSRRVSGEHLLALQGRPWVRLSGTGPNGVMINVEVADASSGDSGGWLLVGDSITTGYGGHNPTTSSSGVQVSGIDSLVAAGSEGRFRPLVQNNGVACSRSSDALTWLDSMLDQFHGHYVSLAFGGNDGWDGNPAPDYYANMEKLVQMVTARGMVPVVPTVTWPNNGGAWEASISSLNDRIRRLYAEHPEVIPGPDLYTVLKGHPELYYAPGDVHLNDQGWSAIRQAWADTLLTTIYQ